ncbi:cellulose synthase-like protein E1 isoform X2 [Coffea eugenioides]|uniref:cellulose synthase-like protein E1 isoform X2 n=1 Tax=Coffea eugenioides TaxID=49369 RepID=UPI000F60B322|nr:cellulose synthase-like protein E1 isoform X2 [Coffea eugenioides]
MGSGATGKSEYIPLFETEKAKGRIVHRLFATSIFVGIILIWIYRASHIPRSQEDGRWAWIGMFGAEIWFGLYWFITQSVRWSLVYRRTFTDRLSRRFENELPKVDIFVCTADPAVEPPIMVINTVLSVMAYDYPTEKLSVYLSDDGGSELTFHALLEASYFSKHWLPYCKKYKVEPRSPAAYFESDPRILDANHTKDFASIKKLYEQLENKVLLANKLGQIPDKSEHKGFAMWDSSSSRGNHDTILQILVNGSDPEARDVAGCKLPTLVYLAREKRPEHFHNFKAGAMNALIRVSSEISNGPVILNVDCDMYSNDSQSIRDALCFLMDEEKGHEFAYVQFPQIFKNITKNDLYANSMTAGREVEFHGLDAFGGPPYIGSGCFQRREILSGRKYSKCYKIDLKTQNECKMGNVHELEERLKSLASCTYEQNTEWGHEMGLKYGCPVEDVITGLSIQCQGWKSVYPNPERPAFLGVAGTTLDQILVQQKRWSEGDLQILLSKYSPAWYGLGRIHIGLTMGYLIYCLWSPNCVAVLYYSIIPSLHLLKGIPLFPQVSSVWFLPFAYVIIAEHIYSAVEFLLSGGTFLGWWNEQRMWLYKRTSSYLLAFVDTILKLLGFSDLKFVISSKVSDEDASKRYGEEILEFGTTSPMFIIISTLALLNLFCLTGILMKLKANLSLSFLWETMALQILLCGAFIVINLPLFDALFFRKDNGRMPSSVTSKSMMKIWWWVVTVVLVSSLGSCFGIRFVIDREECISHKVEYGATVHYSFVVIKSDGSWHFSHEGVDLVVKGPTGEQVHDFRDKTSEKDEFVAYHEGVYKFCFTNKSPYHETIDFDVQAGHFVFHDEHAKDEHFKPLFEHISKLEEALYNIQFEQHWLEAQTERQAIVNEGMGKRVMHKAMYESLALIAASVLQVYLLRRLFDRKLGISRV